MALLNRSGCGDRDAEAALTPTVYDELQRMAKRLFRTESRSHTLQPTAIVHEAFVKLVDVDMSWQGRANCFSLAATHDAPPANESRQRRHALGKTLTPESLMPPQPTSTAVPDRGA